MKAIQVIGAFVAFALSVYIGRIVLHGLTDHDHLDGFHLVVTIALVLTGVVLLLRALRPGPEPA